MSHFNIIHLSSSPVEKDSISGDAIYDDPRFLQESYWGGDPVDDYDAELASIKDDFACIADVDTEKRTLTFKDKETVKAVWLQHVEHIIAAFKKNIEESKFWQAEYALRKEMQYVNGINDLIYMEDYCQSISNVISDYLTGFIPQTRYIGAILDAHC